MHLERKRHVIDIIKLIRMPNRARREITENDVMMRAHVADDEVVHVALHGVVVPVHVVVPVVRLFRVRSPDFRDEADARVELGASAFRVA